MHMHNPKCCFVTTMQQQINGIISHLPILYIKSLSVWALCPEALMALSLINMRSFSRFYSLCSPFVSDYWCWLLCYFCNCSLQTVSCLQSWPTRAFVVGCVGCRLKRLGTVLRVKTVNFFFKVFKTWFIKEQRLFSLLMMYSWLIYLAGLFLALQFLY